MVHKKAIARPEITGAKRKKLQNIKSRLMQFCYNENSHKYKNYGARGVKVDPKWHNFKGFLEDFDSIDGWDEDEFMKGNLQLDKDLKYKGNKLYSKDTCMWVTPEENVKVKPSYQRDIVGVNIHGEVEEFSNLTEFAKEHEGLNGVSIMRACKGEQPYHFDWYFYYADEKPNPPLVYEASKEGKVLKSFKQADLERKIADDLPSGTISGIVTRGRKNNIRGWKVNWYTLPLE